MKKFDITFRGEVLPKHDPERVKAGFVELFKIRDSGMLDEIFSGETVVLRSNLDRKAAAEYFVKVNQLGAVIQLVTSSSRYADHENGSANGDNGNEFEPQVVRHKQADFGLNGDILVKQPGLIDRSWPVSAARLGRKFSRTDNTNGAPAGNSDASLREPEAPAETNVLKAQEEQAQAAARAARVAAVAAEAQKIRTAELEQARQQQERAAQAREQAELEARQSRSVSRKRSLQHRHRHSARQNKNRRRSCRKVPPGSRSGQRSKQSAGRRSRKPGGCRKRQQSQSAGGGGAAPG